MASYATPGVYFESVDEDAEAIASIRTDIAAFIGIAQRGPLNKPTAVNSWKQFQATFGTFIPSGYLAYSANAFFQNGGQKMYVVRVAAPSVNTSSNPSVVQPSDGSASVVLNVQGFAPGALVTVQQTVSGQTAGTQPSNRLSSAVNDVSAFPEGSLVLLTQPDSPVVADWHTVQAVDPVAQVLYWESPLNTTLDLTKPVFLKSFRKADRLLQTVDADTNTLTWASPLGPAFNVSQSIQFDSGASASHGDFYDAMGIATLLVRASCPGTWGDGLAVEVAQTSLAATTTTAATSQAQPASGAVSYVQSVAGFLQCSVVKAYQSGAPVAYRRVKSVDFSTNAITWDVALPSTFNPGSSISFETVEFSLTVHLNGQSAEIFPGLSLEPKHARYVESVINPQTAPTKQAAQTAMPSQYIRVRDLFSKSPYPNNLPNPAATKMNDGWLSLCGGRDGIAALAARDFTGDPASEKKWGLRTLEDVDEVSIVAIPDILIEPAPVTAYAPVKTQPPNPCLPGSVPAAAAPPYIPPQAETTPQFSLGNVYLVQQALVTHCEMMRFRFAILDPPDFSGPKQQVDLAKIQSWRNQFDTEFAALYFPWILVLDPLNLGDALVRRVPPSGHVAGVYANTDLTVGVFKAPANATLQWAQDLSAEVTATMQGVLNPLGVDCLRSFSGRGLRVYGARTLSSDPDWRFVNVRRLISMIEHALLLSMQWAVFEPNSVYLWQKVKLSITSFLNAIWRQGALAGNTAEESFFVICDETNNPLATTSVGQLIIDIGVAPAVPAEFIVFRIGRTNDTLEVSE
jgi:phage tail sheath protein FI